MADKEQEVKNKIDWRAWRLTALVVGYPIVVAIIIAVLL